MKRRILLLIKGLGRGGAEQIIVSAAPHLDRDRFSYEVAYLLPWKDTLAKDLEVLGIPTHCLQGGRGVGWVRRLRSLVSESQVDIVHAQSPVAASFARMGLPRKGAPLIVYTEHNVWERYHPLTYRANMLTFPRNDYVFAVSDHVRDSIRYAGPLTRRRMPPVERLYQGINRDSIERWTQVGGVREELGIPAGAPIVGTVANFKTHKRLDHLLHVADRVRTLVPEVRFVLVGQGPLEDEMHKLASTLRLDDTVVFTGFREDAPRIASSFDVFALTSEYEGLSIALIEALALGKPAVVTQVGGLDEVIVDGCQGFLVRVGDVDTFADRIVTLLQDPQFRLQMGAEGRVRATAFDVRRSVERVEQVYEELLA